MTLYYFFVDTRRLRNLLFISHFETFLFILVQFIFLVSTTAFI